MEVDLSKELTAPTKFESAVQIETPIQVQNAHVNYHLEELNLSVENGYGNRIFILIFEI